MNKLPGKSFRDHKIMQATTTVTMIQRTLLLLALLIAGIGVAHAAAPVNTLEKAVFGFKPNGIAIRGYDTVAYFTKGAPVEGISDYAIDWNGATWQFSSQENLDKFIETPESYAPQYGGYCAYGVSKGGLVKIEPSQWTIVDDKLYLNFDESVKIKWRKDTPRFIAKADRAFPELLEKD